MNYTVTQGRVRRTVSPCEPPGYAIALVAYGPHNQCIVAKRFVTREFKAFVSFPLTWYTRKPSELGAAPFTY